MHYIAESILKNIKIDEIEIFKMSDRTIYEVMTEMSIPMIDGRLYFDRFYKDRVVYLYITHFHNDPNIRVVDRTPSYMDSYYFLGDLEKRFGKKVKSEVLRGIWKIASSSAHEEGEF